MGKLYQCDWERSDACIGIHEDRTRFMSFTAGNDRQETTLCCLHCCPEWITLPSVMRKHEEETDE